MLYAGFVLVFIGIFIIISGIIGLFRFPDFFTKIHAASVIECCGIPFCLVGLSLMQDQYSTAIKLILMALLIFILNPVSTFAIGKASLPYKIDADGRIR